MEYSSFGNRLEFFYTMSELLDIYKKYFSSGFELGVASNPVGAAGDAAQPKLTKVKARPIFIKGEAMCQVTRTVGAQELHENMTGEKAAEYFAELTGVTFKQIEIKSSSGSVTVLASKKGKLTIKERKLKTTQEESCTQGNTGEQTRLNPEHNKQKNYCLPEGTPVPFLVELGVMTAAGKVVASRYDKFRQINRYLEFVADIVPSLPKDRELSIIDFGCGKSYLTFALYYYLHEKLGFNVRITGLDLKADVIKHCNELSQKFGYEKLEFLHGDIADYSGTDKVDMVVTLHACDTATDYALEKAVKWGASVIFCVPCCQHELNKQIKCEELNSVLKYGLLKERIAALVTDGLRAEMLEEAGYRTQVLEFIDMEHTPKNILIRAVRQPLKIKKKTDYRRTAKLLNVEPKLEELLGLKIQEK